MKKHFVLKNLNNITNFELLRKSDSEIDYRNSWTHDKTRDWIQAYYVLVKTTYIPICMMTSKAHDKQRGGWNWFKPFFEVSTHIFYSLYELVTFLFYSFISHSIFTDSLVFAPLKFTVNNALTFFYEYFLMMFKMSVFLIIKKIYTYLWILEKTTQVQFSKILR